MKNIKTMYLNLVPDILFKQFFQTFLQLYKLYLKMLMVLFVQNFRITLLIPIQQYYYVLYGYIVHNIHLIYKQNRSFSIIYGVALL